MSVASEREGHFQDETNAFKIAISVLFLFQRFPVSWNNNCWKSNTGLNQFHAIPPENIRKSKVFWGYRKRSAVWKGFNKLFPKVKICSENPFGCVNYVWNWIVENDKVFIKKTSFYYNYLNNKWIITCSKSFKVNNRNTRKRCEIYSKLTIKTREQRHDVALVFLLLTLNIFHIFF